MTDYSIIGNGVAGTTAAETIRLHDKKGKITVFTDEDIPFYFRPRLNDFISGDITEQALIAKKKEWYRDLDIDLHLRTRITSGDHEKRTIITHDNQSFSYDSILIATGSHSFVPPIKGSDMEGVFSLRDIQDARDIFSYTKEIEDVVLIGGGLLGLEAGNAIRKRGKRVTVVEFFPRLLPRQLDEEGAKRLQSIMENMGFSFRLGAKTREITGENRTSNVYLEDGEELFAQMVVISAGVRPNMEIAESFGLETDKGIKVDEHLLTNIHDIFAAGDVAEFQGIPYGIWPAAMEQGKIAGANMAGAQMTYNGTTMANSLKVVGIDLASAGNIDTDNKHESLIVSDEKIYKKLVLEKDRIIGCIMLGDNRGFNKITKAMADKKDVSKIKDDLLDESFDLDKL